MNYAKNNCKNMDLSKLTKSGIKELKEFYKANRKWEFYRDLIFAEISEEYKDNEHMLQLIKILSKHRNNYSNKDYIKAEVKKVVKREKNKITCRPYLKTTLSNYIVKISNDYNTPCIIINEKSHNSCIDLYLNDIKDIQIEDEYNGQQYHITFRYDDNVDYDMYVSNYDGILMDKRLILLDE